MRKLLKLFEAPGVGGYAGVPTATTSNRVPKMASDADVKVAPNLSSGKPVTAGKPVVNTPAAPYRGSTSAQAIAQASGVKDVNKIQAGQKLTLPGGGSYTVQKGDTMDKIAKQTGSGAAAPQSDQTAAGNQTSSGYNAQSQAQKTPDAAEPVAGQRPGGVAFNQDAGTTSGQAAPASPGQRPGGVAFNQDAGTTSGQAAPASPGQRPGGVAFNQDAGTTSGQAAPATKSSLPITTTGGPTAANPASVNPPTQGGPAVTGGFGQETNISRDSDDVIAKRTPYGQQNQATKSYDSFGDFASAIGNKVKSTFGASNPPATMEEELEEDNELSELMRLSGRPMNKPKMSESIMLEAGSTLEHIVKKFKHETKNFLAGNDLDSDLYDALYDYYSDNGEMPYGVAKARDGDPYQWISDRFADEMQMHGYGRQADMLNMPGADHELTELARLAGLSESQVVECGDMDMEQKDSMNVSTNMSSDGTKSVNISAQGDRADALLQMLKMAGMRPHDNDNSMAMTEPEVIMVSSAPHDDMHEEEMMDEEYANSPEQEYQTIDSIIHQGDDLNREKAQHPVAGFTGDNPLVGEDISLDEELQDLLDSILFREEMTDVLKAEQPYRDEKTGKMVTPPKGATMPPPDSQYPPGDKRNMMPPKGK
jgi:LysM repeat protein